jgi:hypothetical protein
MARARREASYDDEDDAMNPRVFWRFALWGTVAVLCLGAAVIAVRVDTTRVAARTPTGAQLPVRSFDPETEARRLNEAVRLLAADRDRLLARIGALEERNHDDVTITGSVATIPIRPTPVPTSAAQPMPPAAPKTATAAPSPPPSAAPPAARAPAADPGPAASVATKTEFGIDLGAAGSLDGLRNMWSNLRDRHETLLDGLRPVITIREGSKPGVVELHLVAGPLANAGAAARLCAALGSAGLGCQPTVFDGQRLALR